MSNNDTTAKESTDIQPRTRRALERVCTVLHVDGTPIEEGDCPTVVSVFSGNSGKERRVDVREGRCTCPDHEYRGVECAHIRRARFALGRRPLDTATLVACDVHRRFAEHTPGPVVVSSDGGVIGGDTGTDDGTDDDPTDEGDTSGQPAGERVRVPVSGGILVFETCALGKELVGFESVTDWADVADALRARGHDTGAVYHLPELDKNNTSGGDRTVPRRSEPADFGGGESTGVQDL